MDKFGYRTSWKEKGPDPKLRIGARRMRWDIAQGAHPYLVRGESTLFDVDPFAITGSGKVSDIWQPDPRGSVDGHNVATDGNILALLDVDRDVPISPLFVKDLAGRTIYVGGGPEAKSLVDWETYGADLLDEEGGLSNPLIPLVVFPRYCRDVKDRMPGWELLETVLLAKFRTLDMGKDFVAAPSGAGGDDDMLMRAEYPLANLYPYKYRLDTFYVDGWKLPQVQMVFARSEGTKPPDANALGAGLLERWGARGGKDYAAWLEAEGGETFMESLFQKGCTLIPTFEACNGYNVVGRGYTLEGFWPGRAVDGLHSVTARRPDKAPVGTILEVVKPGYVTATTIVPAEVVVSDGSGYISPNAADPLPLVPNLFLPHQRTFSNWRATWVPTHPEHFEVPALWGWDPIGGRFLQMKGPIWDPLHYYYECNELVYQAVKRPLEFNQNRWLVPVPEQMFNRFYPVVPLHGFDVVAFEAVERRRARNTLPFSAVTRVPDPDMSADIGYHPLPVEFEYELDPFWFPQLHPVNRDHGPCPEGLLDRQCPIIRPRTSPEKYAAAIAADDGYPWLADPSMLATPSDNPLNTYPLLARYLLPGMDAEELSSLMPMPFLADAAQVLLVGSAQAAWPRIDDMDDVESLVPGLHEVVWDFRDASLDFLRLRHSIYRAAQGIYRLGYWYGASYQDMQGMFVEWMESQRADAGGAQALSAQGGAVVGE